MGQHHVSQVISTYLNFPTELQFEVLAAVQRNASYIPRDTTALGAAQEHWNIARGSGAGAAFSMRIAPMPHETAPVYRVSKPLTEYLKRLYTGGDIMPFSKVDFREGISAELDAILAATVAKGESTVNLDGVIKCEAMAFLLRHNLGGMSNPVGMVEGNPFAGNIDLHLSDDFIKHMARDSNYNLAQFAKEHYEGTTPAEVITAAQTSPESVS